MSFYNQLQSLLAQCHLFQKEVEEQELLFTEPYQSKYLNINKLLKTCAEKKLEIEAVAAGEQSASDLSPARAEYYELEELVPPFLAGEKKFYFYLQTYKIACIKLLKIFSYSSFKGDWAKMRQLQSWYSAIENEQEKQNAEASLKKSLTDLKSMGDFENLDLEGLKSLQEEVHNIQTLLTENAELESIMTAEDSELLQIATAYLKANEDRLTELPKPNTNSKQEPTPALETFALRCKQLMVLTDDFPEDCDKDAKAVELFEFQQALKDSFNLNITICNDLHAALVKSIGAHKKPAIKTLCKMLHDAIEPFADLKKLNKKYPTPPSENSLDIQRGMPDTVELEAFLNTAIGR